MKVIATAAAFYGGVRVRPGDTVEVPDKFKASWFAQAGEVKAGKAKGKKQEPVALSQLPEAKGASFNDVHGGDDIA